MPTLFSMRETLVNSEQVTTTEQKTFKPRDPQEVNLNTINVDEEVRIRFIHDGDTTNAFFWRAYCYHELFFRGVKGDSTKDNIYTFVQVPAFNTIVDKLGKITRGENAMLNVPQASAYTNAEDPIQIFASQNNLYEQSDRTIRTISGKEISLYSALKRKVQYLIQGYIVKAPESLKIYEDARLLKHFRMVDQVYDIIHDHIKNEDSITMKDDPINNAEGVDFNFKKTLQGQFNDYKKSYFSRAHTSLSPEALADYNQYGADHINDRIPKAPNGEEREIIKQMLEAMIAGQPYDPAWDVLKYYKYTRVSNNSEPTWNSPVNTYTTPVTPTETVSQSVSAQNKEALNDLLGGTAIPQDISAQVNDEIPYANSTPQSVEVKMDSQEETLSYLKNLQ